ncbi:MAG: hypothetical protein N3B15_06795 [Planctomycetota bacterium]|nr:hypothetical protein [Planctomycetota bacterium]
MRWALWAVAAAVLAGERLPLPGWPVPGDRPLPAIGWAAVPGAVLALDADGAVRRRVPLAPGGQAWIGRGGVLVADDRGLRWLDDAGSERRLPPLPPGVQPLGVDGAAAFFARDQIGWRLDQGGARQHLVLPEPPIGCPLACGPASLWLTMHHLVWWDGELQVAHRHGLPAGRGWRLAWAEGEQPVILAPDGRLWLVPPYAPGADDERLGREPQPPADPEAAWRAALRRGAWSEAARLAATAEQRAAVAWYAGSPSPAAPAALIPGEASWWSLPSEAWPWGCAPWAGSLLPRVPTARAAAPLADAAQPAPEQPALRALPQGLLRGALSWRISDDGERVTLACRDGERERWFRRWLSPEELQAPAWSLSWQSGWLVVVEGDARLLIVDAGTGRLAVDLRPRRAPLAPGRLWPLPGGALCLAPPGREDRLIWMLGDEELVEPLPERARWLLVLPDGEAWLALRDGRAFAARAPGQWRELALPPALLAAEGPELGEGGILAEGRLWRWR